MYPNHIFENKYHFSNLWTKYFEYYLYECMYLIFRISSYLCMLYTSQMIIMLHYTCIFIIGKGQYLYFTLFKVGKCYRNRIFYFLNHKSSNYATLKIIGIPINIACIYLYRDSFVLTYIWYYIRGIRKRGRC